MTANNIDFNWNNFVNWGINFAGEMNFGGGMPGMPGGMPQQQNPNSPSPPASKRLLRNLPTVTVTSDDLTEETNKNCCICLEDQVIGSTAVKLPCGHIFHSPCLIEWLEKSCMCPICRYELETDDVDYEKERKTRMKTRKPRMRRDELKSKTIGNLKDLMQQLGVSSSGCVDKSDLIERLVKCGKIDIVEGVPSIEISREEIESKSVSELKNLCKSFGLTVDNPLYKSDFINKLIESGRIVVQEPRENLKDDSLHRQSFSGNIIIFYYIKYS